MPKVKLIGKARESRSGFEPYDGPTPKQRGMYRAVLKKITYGPNNSGSTGFNMVFELEAQKGDPKDHARFDGYPMFSSSIITESSDGAPLKEGAQRNLENLLAALGVKDDPEMIVDDGDGKVVVKRIGGKNPVGSVMTLDVAIKTYEGELRPEIASVLPFKDSAAPAKASSALDDEDDSDDENDLLEEEAEEESEEIEESEDDEATEYDERAEELDGLGIPALKKLAKDLGLPVGGKKSDLVERILEAEFTEDEDAPAALADDDDLEELEESEDDEIEEEDDEEADRREELSNIDRLGLKKILNALDKDFQFKKSHTEDDLINEIIAREFEDETPF